MVSLGFRSIFFINSYEFLPKIMKASLAGGGLQVLIGSGLHNPSGLTIDYNMNGRLFWADYYRDVIESCLADGSDRTVLVPAGKGTE
jgi:hypothetical protein